jgi:hypothetical protein
MKIKKLIGLGVLSGIIAISFSGCNDNDIDGTYSCYSPNTKQTTLMKIDGNNWDMQLDGKWLQTKADKIEDSTFKMTYILNKNSDTDIYTLSANIRNKGKDSVRDYYTFKVNENKNILLKVSSNSMRVMNNTLCTKNQ